MLKSKNTFHAQTMLIKTWSRLREIGWQCTIIINTSGKNRHGSLLTHQSTRRYTTYWFECVKTRPYHHDAPTTSWASFSERKMFKLPATWDCVCSGEAPLHCSGCAVPLCNAHTTNMPRRTGVHTRQMKITLRYWSNKTRLHSKLQFCWVRARRLREHPE